MLVENQKVEVHWCPANRKMYESFGYIYTGMRDSLIIEAEHLSPKSAVKVFVKCDYCGKIYQTSYKLYMDGIKVNGKACCKNCNPKKREEIMLEKHGYKNPFESKEVQDRIKIANLQKFGFENPAQAPEIQEKIITTNLEKYGVPYSIMSESTKEKTKQTNIKKFGAKNPFGNKEIQEKARKTMLENHGVINASYIPDVIEKRKQTSFEKRGVPSPFQDPVVIKKIRESLYQNGKVPSSNAERELCKLLIKMYGEDKCTPSYPFYNLSFDCLVQINGIKIDIEYDGWYWHKNRQEEDKRRNYFLMRRGFKIIRFQAEKTIPTKEQIQQAVNELLTTSKKIIIVKLDI